MLICGFNDSRHNWHKHRNADRRIDYGYAWEVTAMNTKLESLQRWEEYYKLREKAETAKDF